MSATGGRLRRVLRPLVALALLALVWRLIDGPTALARLREADPRWLLAGLALVQLQVLLSAWRWRLTAGRLGQRLAPGRALSEYYLATLLNQTLPGGVAGDAGRALRGGAGASLTLAAQGVVVERLAGQLSLVAVSVAGMLLWPSLLEGAAPRVGWLALGAVATLAVAVALAIALATVTGPPRLRAAAASAAPLLHRCWLADGQWLAQGALSLGVTAAYAGLFACAAFAVGAPLPLAALVTIVPLTLASMLVPIGVAGWGLREAAAAALWPLAALSPESGVAASVVYGLLSLVGALPGALVAARPARPV